MTRVVDAEGGDQTGVRVEFASPPAMLAPYVSAYYTLHVAPGEVLEDYLHPEWANIRIMRYGLWEAQNPGRPLLPVSGGQLHGPTSQMTYIRGKGAGSFGIGLLPAGWARLVRRDASQYADRMEVAGDVFGAGGTALTNAVVAAKTIGEMAGHASAFLLERLELYPQNATDALVLRAHEILLDPNTQSVDDMADNLGLSIAALARFSKKHFGFTPKLLLNRQRFLRMLGEMHLRPYAEWRDFLDPLYVDQSHMIRDFQKFLGMSPSQYFALDRPILRAAAIGRAAALGSPLQGLHRPETA